MRPFAPAPRIQWTLPRFVDLYENPSERREHLLLGKLERLH